MGHIWKRSYQGYGDSHAQYLSYTRLPDPAPWAPKSLGSMQVIGNRGESRDRCWEAQFHRWSRQSRRGFRAQCESQGQVGTVQQPWV